MNTIKTINYNQILPEQLVEVFEKHNVYFKRDLRISVLKEIIEPTYELEKKELEKLKDDSPNSMSIKDSIRLNRLKSYKKLSEFQLENDFIYYDNPQLVELYLKQFWAKLSMHIQSLDNSAEVFADIDKLEKTAVKIKAVCDYNRYFSSRVIDEENYFDGIHLVEAVKHFNQTSLAAEIKKLSDKYRISIPRYWTKDDLKLRLKKALKAKYELTPDMAKRIDNSTVNKLKELLEEHHIDSKLHITKTDMINIIIKNVDKNKVSEVAKEAEKDILEPLDEGRQEKKVEGYNMSKLENSEAVEKDNSSYLDLLRIIIANQEIMIKQNTDNTNNNFNQKSFKLNKIFNIIIISLIIVVAIIWIIYGIDTLFQ